MLKVFYDDQRHLICTPYSVPNLHRAAALLGLKKCWFHASPYPHYDLPKRWVEDFGLRLDEQLLNLDFHKVPYEQVTPRQLLTIIKKNTPS